ncbi:MAG: hypothetical protein ACRDJG_11910 [Actinomycetota bacterium]
MSIRPQRRERPRTPGAATKVGHLVVIPGGAGRESLGAKPAEEHGGQREAASRPKLPRMGRMEWTGSEAAPAGSEATRPGLGFALVCSLIVGASVLGLVVLNVLVAQSSFRLGDLRARVEEEEARSRRLHYEVSAGESPAKLAEAAHRLGLVIPERQEILVGPPDPALSAKGSLQMEGILRARGESLPSPR